MAIEKTNTVKVDEEETKARRQVTKERICNKISKSMEANDVDGALWLCGKLFVMELKASKTGSKEMKTTLASFTKMLIDIKRTNPQLDIDKGELLQELLEYMNPPKENKPDEESKE